MYKTIKTALADGFEHVKAQHYDGDILYIKGHTLTKNPRSAKSKTAWKREGRVVMPNQEAHAILSWSYPGKGSHSYFVYRYDQTETEGEKVCRECLAVIFGERPAC